jgi:hypothetical protein
LTNWMITAAMRWLSGGANPASEGQCDALFVRIQIGCGSGTVADRPDDGRGDALGRLALDAGGLEGVGEVEAVGYSRDALVRPTR